jgi:hypothetical protein
MMTAGRWVVAVSMAGTLLLAAFGFAQETKKDGGAPARPEFAEADAARMLDAMRQALESNSRSRFLKLFDAARMPGYAAFRDEVVEFFETYNSMRMNYQIIQVAMEGEFGAVVAQITLEASPQDGTPSVRRSAQTRLVLAWDGKTWRAVDLAPRDLFRSGN